MADSIAQPAKRRVLARGLLTASALALIPFTAAMAAAQQTAAPPQQVPPLDTSDDTTSRPATAAPSSEEDAAEAGDIVVTGVRGSLVGAQDAKREASIIADFVTQEDVGKYTDQNLAETLQRVPGVQIARSQSGEGSFVSIRGLGPQFVQVTINGRTAFGGSGGDDGLANRNALSLDAVAPELTAGVEVYKSTRADLQEGGIGGGVNILTTRPLDLKVKNGLYDDGLYLAGNIDGTYAVETKQVDPRVSGFFSWKNEAETFGVLGNIAYYDRTTLTQISRIITTDFDDTLEGVPNVFRPASDSEYAMNDGSIERLGYGFTLQFRPSEQAELTVDIFRNDQMTARRQNTLRMRLPSDIAPLLENADILRTNDTPGIGGVLLGGTILRRPGLAEDAQPYGSIGPNYTVFDRTEKSYATHLTLKPGAGRLKIDLDASYYKSEFDRDEDIAAYEIMGVNGFEYRTDKKRRLPVFTFLPDPATGAAFDVSNLQYGDPVDFGFNRINAGGDELGFRLDADYEWNFGPVKTIEVGLNYRRRKQDQVFNVIRYNLDSLNDVLTQAGIDPATTPNFGETAARRIPVAQGGFLSEVSSIPYRTWDTLDARRIFAFYRPAIDQVLALQGVDLDERAANPGLGLQFGPFGGNGFFRGREDIYAGYAMANLESTIAGLPFTSNFGARLVKTKIRGEGLRTATALNPTTGNTIAVDANGNPITSATRQTDTGSSLEFLPSGNINFALARSVQLRFAASRVVTRPDLGAVTGASSVGFDTQDGSTITGINVSLPNPDLGPFKANQYDAIIEWYPTGTQAFVAAGFFYKDIKTLIAGQTLFPEEYTLDGVTYRATDTVQLRVSQPVNSGDAVVSGIELQGHMPFNLFSETSFLRHFGIQGTYTRLLKNRTSVVDSVTGERLPFDGASRNNYSLIGYFDNGRLSTRASYTYRSKSSAGAGFFNESYTALDANVDYRITENWAARIQLTNLLEEPFRQSTAGGRLPYLYSQNGRLITFGARAQF